MQGFGTTLAHVFNIAVSITDKQGKNGDENKQKQRKTVSCRAITTEWE